MKASLFLMVFFCLLSCKQGDWGKATQKDSVTKTEFLSMHAKESPFKGAGKFEQRPCEKSPWPNPTPNDCFLVSENIHLNLFWIRSKEVQVQKPLLVFLHGGPGGTLVDYKDMEIFQRLKETFDVLLFTQRGAGLSSSLKNKSELESFTLQAHLSDLHALVQHFGIDQKAVVMGHSYGAHLALAYAALHPQNTLKVVALNGAADSLGFVMQSTVRMNLFEQVMRSSLTELQLKKALALEAKGVLKNENGLPISSFFSELHEVLYSYKGLKEELPARIQAIYQTNFKESSMKLVGAQDSTMFLVDQDSTSTISPKHTAQGILKSKLLEEESFFPRPRKRGTTQQLMLNGTPNQESFNEILNQWIVCANLVTPKSILKAPKAFQELPMIRREARCEGFKTQEQAHVETFDLANRMKDLSSPVLLTSGTHDPLIPMALQERDFARILKGPAGPLSSWIVIQETGHNPDEDPLCLEQAVLQFAQGILPSGSFTCQSGILSPAL